MHDMTQASTPHEFFSHSAFALVASTVSITFIKLAQSVLEIGCFAAIAAPCHGNVGS